jgi:hypothetical protein
MVLLVRDARDTAAASEGTCQQCSTGEWCTLTYLWLQGAAHCAASRPSHPASAPPAAAVQRMQGPTAAAKPRQQQPHQQEGGTLKAPCGASAAAAAAADSAH